LIEVRNLCKQYGNHIAVDDLSFSISKGGIYGFLGPNGAGKSTTMNIMTGCLAATSGEVIIGGYDILENPEEAKRGIGYLPEQPPLYIEMTPAEYLHFVGEVKGLKKSELDAQVNTAMEKTGVTEMQDRLIKNLSKGYRQRVGIAQAILGDPQLIILDEPTVGLDPIQIVEIRDFIRELGREHTVILSSHILSEVSAVCDHIMIISHGKLVASQPTEEITAFLKKGTNTLDLTVKGDAKKTDQTLSVIPGVKQVSVVPGTEKGTVRAVVEYDSKLDLREAVFRAMARADCPLLSMTLSTATLEQVFMELTAENEAGPANMENQSTGESSGKTKGGEAE
jgi:ABC-2 type transport system ATP-binding protein